MNKIAHCVSNGQSGRLTPADQLTVRVGLHRLDDPSIESKTFNVRKVIVHSRYFTPGRSTSGPGDIALLEIDG